MALNQSLTLRLTDAGFIQITVITGSVQLIPAVNQQQVKLATDSFTDKKYGVV